MIKELHWGYRGELTDDEMGFGSGGGQHIEGQIEVLVAKLNEVITQVNDLVATNNQSQVEPLKSAQSDPKRKANT